MDKAQALYNFWAGFGLPALDEQSDLDTEVMDQLGLDFPYLTFESAIGELGEPTLLGADLYYRSTSWTEIKAKAEEISQAIGPGGIKVAYDGGQIWITRGSPAYRSMSPENDFSIRRIHININAEFLTA